MLPDEKPHGLGTQRESGGGECRNSDDFGLRSVLSHSENISDETCYPCRGVRR